MDDASIAALREALQESAPDESDDGVWPENVETVMAFLSVASQWRVIAIGGSGWSASLPLFIGLDYSAVRVCLDAEAIAVTAELWRGLRIMEAAACAVLNKADS